MAGTIAPSTVGHRARGVVKIKGAWITASTGAADATVLGAAYGRLVAVGYLPGDTATGVDLTVKDVDTGATLLALTNAGTSPLYFRPTTVATTSAGAAITPADTAPGVNRDILVAGKISLTVAQGGSGKTGALYLVFDENPAPPPSAAQFA